MFLKNVAFHGILLDALFEEDNQEWTEVSQLLRDGIAGGVVQPLKTTVFRREQVEEAFRFMAQGKHIGKVLLQVTFPTKLNAPCRLVQVQVSWINVPVCVCVLTHTGVPGGGRSSQPRPRVLPSHLSDLLSSVSVLHHHRGTRRLRSGARSLADRARSPEAGADVPIGDQER